MPSKPRPYVRQMPRIYGNLQPTVRPGARWIGLGVRLGIVFGLAAYLLNLLFFGPLFRVRTVSVVGATFSSADRVQASVPTGSNIWLVSAGEIRTQVLGDPAVRSVAVLRGLPHTVRVTVSEQPVAVIWQTGNALALINDGGEIFKLLPVSALADSPLKDLRATVPLIVDSHNLPVVLGQDLLSPQFIAFSMAIQKNLTLNVSMLHPDRFSVVNSTYDVTLLTQEGPQVRLSSLNDPNVQLRNLARLMIAEKLPMNAQIDLRVNRWAYVHE